MRWVVETPLEFPYCSGPSFVSDDPLSLAMTKRSSSFATSYVREIGRRSVLIDFGGVFLGMGQTFGIFH